MRWVAAAAAWCGCLQCTIGVTPAQSNRAADLGAGKLLVASRDLPDPNFAKTVVLLVQYDEEGVVGVIVNRRSKVPVSQVLEGLEAAKGRPDPVYAGGPVGRTEVLALVRAPRPPADAKRVFGDVFLASSKELLEKTFTSAVPADRVRIYLGYAGWTAPQLEREMDLGAWFIFPATDAAIFETEPEALWQRLIRETELRIARAGR